MSRFARLISAFFCRFAAAHVERAPAPLLMARHAFIQRDCCHRICSSPFEINGLDDAVFAPGAHLPGRRRELDVDLREGAGELFRAVDEGKAA